MHIYYLTASVSQNLTEMGSLLMVSPGYSQGIIWGLLVEESAQAHSDLGQN